MPTIEIKEATLQRLQEHAKPYLHDTVINTALDALDEKQNRIPEDAGGERIINPSNLPNLAHTRVLDASIAGIPASKLRWNHIIRDILLLAAERDRDFEYLRKLARPMNMVENRKTDVGYVHLPNLAFPCKAMMPTGHAKL